jgi:hypothetical protein
MLDPSTKPDYNLLALGKSHVAGIGSLDKTSFKACSYFGKLTRGLHACWYFLTSGAGPCQTHTAEFLMM